MRNSSFEVTVVVLTREEEVVEGLVVAEEGLAFAWAAVEEVVIVVAGVGLEEGGAC